MSEVSNLSQQLQSRYEKVCARIGELYLELDARQKEMAGLIQERDRVIMEHRKLTENGVASGNVEPSRSVENKAS